MEDIQLWWCGWLSQMIILFPNGVNQDTIMLSDLTLLGQASCPNYCGYSWRSQSPPVWSISLASQKLLAVSGFFANYLIHSFNVIRLLKATSLVQRRNTQRPYAPSKSLLYPWISLSVGYHWVIHHDFTRISCASLPYRVCCTQTKQNRTFSNQV